MRARHIIHHGIGVHLARFGIIIHGPTTLGIGISVHHGHGVRHGTGDFHGDGDRPGVGVAIIPDIGARPFSLRVLPGLTVHPAIIVRPIVQGQLRDRWAVTGTVVRAIDPEHLHPAHIAPAKLQWEAEVQTQATVPDAVGHLAVAVLHHQVILVRVPVRHPHPAIAAAAHRAARRVQALAAALMAVEVTAAGHAAVAAVDADVINTNYIRIHSSNYSIHKI